MPRTLYGKLLAVLLALFLPLGILLVLLSAFAADMYQMEVSQKLNRELAAHIVAEQQLLHDQQVDHRGLAHLFHMMMAINPAIEVYLLDPAGRVLAHAAPDHKVRRARVDLAPLYAFLAGATAFPILGDDPRTQAGRKAFSAAPILTDRGLQGYLYVILGGEEYDGIVDRLKGSFIGRLSAWAVTAGLLFALAAAALVLGLMMRRLKRLARAMDAFRAGDPAALPGEYADIGPPRDEIDRLGVTFVQMARRIEEQLRGLERNDALRRELVANVSHDLRTPLASLRGYLETLLIKGRTLGEAERHGYLEIAVRHARRLGRRIDELFEIATLDAQERPPRCEPVSLAELVQDVALKFRLEAERKGVALEVELPPAPPFVCADIGLLERALDNLIVNALRYTPAGGAVGIALGVDAGRICLRVTDTGVGIAPQALLRVFDRFYRDRRVAGVHHNGAGLGLAISKRIVELHGGTIEAESQAARGTTFRLYLPLAPVGLAGRGGEQPAPGTAEMRATRSERRRSS
jgi:signal transduction histidine kinase